MSGHKYKIGQLVIAPTLELEWRHRGCDSCGRLISLRLPRSKARPSRA